MKTMKRILLFFLTLSLIIPSGLPVMTEAATTDAMIAIESELSAYKRGSVIKVANDGYIGIPVDVHTYFNKDKFIAKSGYNGTQVIIYVVNTNTERIGRDSDVNIITSMLERGYIVTVFDYKNNPLATGQPLEWSVQGLRVNVKNKTYLVDSAFPAGTYYDNYIVPAGYNVSLNNVYWEMDKHASDGTFDFIINNWNTDFRNIKGDKLVKWVHEDGTRKTVLDGATWYNASGSADANGEYVKVKYTVAEKITDCVKPDGSPIDLNQSMSFVYPANPENNVPVYCMASSSQYLAATPQTEDRVHFNGFLFRGYAGVVYEYGYVPMARDDSYGVYNGSKSTYPAAVTDDSDNYGVHMYDDKRINTAAMRYIRYKALSEPSTYKFDIDHIGIIGNSKGGAMSFVGEKIVQEPLVSNPASYATTEALELAIDTKINSIISRRGHAGHHNETRFQNGYTESYTFDGITIDGGEKQPWLTYNGVEIESGAQLVWASNGVSGEDISEGHSPQIVMCHEQDPWHYYGPLNEFANICRSHNIPMLHFEVPLAHTVAYGKDLNYNLDVYEAAFDFIGYYLKGNPVKVLYTNPQNGGANVGVVSPITVKFSGGVSLSEVNKITLSANGESVTGTWKSSYGNTTWEFTPDVLCGNTKYTLTVPEDLKGENGVPTGSPYTAEFYTEFNINSAATSVSEVSDGKLVTVTAPQIEAEGNIAKLRFRVTNDGANVIGVYSENGTLIDKVNIKSQGYYEADVTNYVAGKSGQQVKFLVKEEKAQQTTDVYTSDFSKNYDKCSVAEMTQIGLAAAPDSTPALKVIKTDSGSKYTDHVIFNSSRIPAFTVNNILGFKISEADYGRKFTFTVRLYDTVSRFVQLKLNTNTSSTQEVADYDNPMYNFTTKAGEWTTYSFDYAVYDTDYGKIGLKNKNLIISLSHAGDTFAPLYISEINVKEIVTGISMDNFSVALENNGSIAYKMPEEDKIFALYNGAEKVAGYNSWKEALSAYKYGYTLKLTDNYNFTDADAWGEFSSLTAAKGADGNVINIDLNGYKINCLNEKNSLLWQKNTSNNGKTVINVSNGAINLKNTPLISYGDSTASGTGKATEINFNNVDIGVLHNAYMDNIMSASSITSGVNASVNISLEECNINLPDDKFSPEYRTIFSAGGGNLNVKYEIKGGNLNLSSQRWIKIQDKLDTCTYKADSKGKYMTLTMPSSAVQSTAAYMLDGTNASSYELKFTENNISTYELSVSDLSTRYGVIPAEYSSSDDYPFVWFDESGTFKGASNQLYGNSAPTSIFGLAKTYLADNKYSDSTNSYGANPLGAFVVVRKDYTLGSSETYSNMAQVQGTLVVDLNGHTITQNNKPLIDSTAKRWGSSGDLAIFPTEVRWENGTLELKNNSLVHFTAWDANGSGDVENKEFIHTFKNVTLKLAENANVSSLFTIGQNGSTPTAKSKGFVNLYNCKIDMKTVSPAKMLTLFNAGSQYINMTYKITGSKLYADSMANINFSTVVENSKVVAEKNEDDQYLKIFVTEANKNTVTTSSVSTARGTASFIESGKEDGYAVFTLEEIIPSVPVITAASVTRYVNVGTTEAPSYEIKTDDIFSVLTDGKIATNSSIIQYYNPKNVTNNKLDATENANQHWLIELDKVHTLNYVELVHSRTDKWIKFNVSVSTDNQTWNDLGTIEVSSVGATNKPVKLPLGSARGKYIKISVAAMQGNTTVNSAGNTVETVWGPNQVGGGCSVALYEILSVTSPSAESEQNELITEYGVIPAEYASKDSYPFVWFDEAGNFKGASAKLFTNDNNSVTHQAKEYLKGNVYSNNSYGENPKAAYIVMRKDYTMGSTETYGYVSQIQGALTIDLNGFKLTQNGKPIIDSKATKWSWSGDATIFPTDIVIKNGEISLKNNSILHFSSYDSSAAGNIKDKVFNYLFEDITISLASRNTVSSLFTFETSVANLLNPATVNVNMMNVKFDFDTVVPTKELTVFNANGQYIESHYNITDSEIYTETMNNINVSSVNSGSSVQLLKGTDGEYLKFYVKTENKDSFNISSMLTEEGEKSFIEWGKEEAYSIYSIGNNPLLTKYGIIPAEYASEESYPFVWFDEAGNFKGASAKLFTNDNNSVTHQAKEYLKGNVYSNNSYGENPKAAYIVMRKDYTMGSTETYGYVSQIQGALTIDLNGFKLTQNGKPIIDSKATKWSWSGDATIFPTDIVIKNGEISLKNNSILHFSSYDSSAAGNIKDKVFNYLFEDITISLASGNTVSSLFTFETSVANLLNPATVNVNMMNVKFDFDTVVPTKKLTVFNANGQYIESHYNITGSEIYADSMEKINLFVVEGNSSVMSVKDASEEYLKVKVKNENKESFVNRTMLTKEGELAYKANSSDEMFTLYTLSKDFIPTVVSSNNVFASLDYFSKDENKYLGPVGVVFATAPVSFGEYTRIEYGFAFSKVEFSSDDIENNSAVTFAKASGADETDKYAVKFYGKGIEFGKTYYAVPYAKYKDSNNNIITVYAENVIMFSPAI